MINIIRVGRERLREAYEIVNKVDQGLRGKDAKGNMIYNYGGDFNSYADKSPQRVGTS